ncbi:MAG: hypothetical protein Q4F23_06865 [Coriobacteriia bacterium]|nr:hypothetical protein [Coriobacteriia bacterium]
MPTPSNKRHINPCSHRLANGALSVVLTAGLCLPVGLNAASAYADSADAKQAMTKAQKAVEESADAYDKAEEAAASAQSDANDAQELVSTLETKVKENQGRIAQLKEDIPVQQEVTNDAVRSLYRLSQNATGMLEMFLGAGSLTDFLSQIEYLGRIEDENVEQVKKLTSMKDELEDKQASLEDDMNAAKDAKAKAEAAATKAQAAKNDAASALADAKKARRKAKAEYEAQVKAEKEAAAKAAKEKKDAEEAAASVRKGALAEGEDNDGSTAANEKKDSKIESSPTDDGADWSDDKSAFVAKWSKRIDSFLSGSPMAGQGKTFAVAAWKYGVDPRWSPAIAYMESSLGAHCFKSHNAWGWGSSSWGSWEEAINAHVSGLARMYGYTLSLAAAKKYCPPNWKHWYNVVGSKMNSI